jgi:DNA-directed RNA polymerase specialized sigma24 family protein
MLTRDTLDSLLSCLDQDRERAGEKYETLRQGLVRFFEWRGCVLADKHADETIDRAARKMAQGEEIRNIHSYLVAIARFVYLEVAKEQEKVNTALRQILQNSATPESQPEDLRLDCVRACLQSLPAESSRLLMDYYQGQTRAKIDSRRRMAEDSGISAHALRMRLHRIRLKLEECAMDCMRRRGGEQLSAQEFHGQKVTE